MAWLTTVAIWNAGIATLLAFLAYTVGRYAKSAAVGHALWILVLVKLITPPLFEIPLRVLPSSTLSTPVSREAVTESSTPVIDISTSPMNHGPIADATASLTSVAEIPSTIDWTQILVALWLIGSLLYATYQVYVIWQMCKLMRLAEPDIRIDRAMHRIAKRANARNYPVARVVPWVGSPMLWGLGGTSVIVLPEQLFDSLDDDAAETLLQHELAHFQRGDQWVRILEFLASTIFWWHPVVWLAIREIEIYEEQCCDAWVVRQDKSRRRRYAEALLDTVDFISDSPDPKLPIAASGLGRVPLLKKRIQSIMLAKSQILGSQARIAVALLVALVPLQPKLLQAKFVSITTPTSVPRQSDPVEKVPSALIANSLQTHLDMSLEEKVISRAPVPEIEYAIASSAYGTYQLVAISGYRARLQQVVAGSAFDLSRFRVSSAAFAPPGDDVPQLAVGSLDGAVRLFDCDTGEQIREVASLGSAVTSVDYSDDGRWLAVGCRDGAASLIDIQGGSVRSLSKNQQSIRSVRFSPDGQRLVVALDTWDSMGEGRVEIWNLVGNQLEQVIGVPGAVGVAGFLNGGNIVTAEWNGNLRLWNSDGEQLLVATAPKDSVSAASFSPDAVPLETLAEVASPLGR